MTDRLPLVRDSGSTRQMASGDSLLLKGALNESGYIGADNLTASILQVSNNIGYNSPALSSLPAFSSGARRLFIFGGSCTITHSSSLQLPTKANIAAAAGDRAEFSCNGGTAWTCIWFQRADGTSLVGAPDSTKLPLAGGQMTGALNEAPPVTIAAVDPIDFGNASNTVIITGNTAISGISTVGQGIGARRLLLFTGTPTLFHTANFVLPTKQNINVAAGDRAEFVYVSEGAWNCVAYTRADGTALASSGSGGASTYTWTQDAAAAVWTIPHNLNRRPSVTVVDTLDNVIVPDVSYVDSNTVQVTHGAAYAGKAYLN